MADNGVNTKINQPISSTNAPNKKNPRKFYNHFLFKALIVTFFLVIFPLFPFEPPNFVNPTIFTTSWEIVHLIFVGVAVSYGLFSRKNDDDQEDENSGNFDNPQYYMSRLLDVSSVFDDEIDGCSNGSCENDDNVKKIETWSSNYVRNEPMLVVAEKNNSGIGREKPLLLPVRSLKSRVCVDKDGNLGDFGVPRVYTRSNTSPIVKGFSSNSKSLSGDDLIGIVHGEDFGISSRGHGRSNPSSNAKEFSSEFKGISKSESANSRVVVSNDHAFADRNNEDSRLFRRSNSSLNSRGLTTHSRRHSSGDYRELDDGGVEDERKEKVEESFVLPSPIPWRSRSGRMEMKEQVDKPTSNLLPPSLEESEAARLLRPHMSSTKELSPPPNVSSPRKQSSSQSSSLLELEAKSVQDFGRRKNNFSSRLPPPPPPPPRFQSTNSQLVKSHARKDRSPSINEVFEMISKKDAYYPSDLKSVTSLRPKEDKSSETKNSETNSKASISGHSKETTDFFEHILMESDDESESEGENSGEQRVETTKVDEGTSEIINDEGRDVDKEADEFIARFREQIRLQRIESIKKSAGQRK